MCSETSEKKKTGEVTVTEQNFHLDKTYQNQTQLNMSAHQLPKYYQLQLVSLMVWTALVMWYTCCKLEYTKIF